MGEAEVKNNSAQEKPKKSCLKWFVWFFILSFIIVGGGVFVINKVAKEASSTDNGPAGPAKNYVYPAPSAEAQNRVINCNDFRGFRANPKSVLCLNLYKTSPQDIESKLSVGNYDNILLYGQNIFFDVATNIEKPADFPSRIYNVAKFTDLITLPKLMNLYGVKDLSFINKDFAPYPALYYEIRNQAELNKNCGSEFNVGGCSLFHYMIVLLPDAITDEDQISKYFNWGRNETDDHLFYRRTVPSDCFVSHIITHETAHTLLYAREHTIVGISMEGNYNKTPKWFNEEQAGMLHTYAPELICDIGISEITGTFSRKVENPNFLKFQSVYPSNFIAGGGTTNDCQKGILTSFYRYLSQGNFEERMPKIMAEIREKSMIKGFLQSDQNFANLLLKFLNNDPGEKEFLNSKGCGI